MNTLITPEYNNYAARSDVLFYQSKQMSCRVL